MFQWVLINCNLSSLADPERIRNFFNEKRQNQKTREYKRENCFHNLYICFIIMLIHLYKLVIKNQMFQLTSTPRSLVLRKFSNFNPYGITYLVCYPKAFEQGRWMHVTLFRWQINMCILIPVLFYSRVSYVLFLYNVI